MIEAREDFHDFMLLHGIPEVDIISMTDEEFQMTLNALLDENSPRIVRRQTQQPRQSQNNHQYQGATLPDGFGNGNLDEDEAYRRAIEASLDDMLIAPHLRPKPSPQNEVGLHPRPSSNFSSHTNTHYQYRDEQFNHPPRPNPKPTPLPSTKSPRTNEISKYSTKDRSPSCSRPRRPANQQTTTQVKKKDNVHQTTSTNPQTQKRQTTTSRQPSTNHNNLVVTNSKPKPSSNAHISGTTTKSQKTTTTTTSRQPTSSGTRTKTTATSASRRTTPTTGTRQPTTGTRQPTTGTRQQTPKRTTNTGNTETKKSISSNDHSTRNPISLATGETIIHSNKPSANQTPRNNTNHKEISNRPPSARSSTNKSDNTNNLQHKKKPIARATFVNDAILDPSPDILHPKHYVDDDEHLFDDKPIYHPPSTKTITNTNHPTSQVSQPKPKPEPPKYVEKPPQQKFSESQILRNIQDMEFIQATQEAERKEQEEAEKKAHAEMLERQEKEKKESKLNEAKRLFKSIPPEPQNGQASITIAAQLPNLKRVMRKFAPNTKGIHVYAWISGQTLELPEEERLFTDSFELMQAMGQAQTLDTNKTLEEQNISGRVFFQISVL